MTYNTLGRPTPGREASFSIPSILAAIAAVATFFVSSGTALLLSIVAIVLGLIGAVVAISPAKRGGIISIISILFGAVAVIVSIFRLIF